MIWQEQKKLPEAQELLLEKELWLEQKYIGPNLAHCFGQNTLFWQTIVPKVVILHKIVQKLIT